VAGDAMDGSVRWGYGTVQREASWRATRAPVAAYATPVTE
jgi:hypothetical protein